MDLVQETFLRATRNGRALAIRGMNEEAWLVRVLVNACRDHWRRERVRSRARTAPAADPRGPESSYVARLAVEHALAGLSPRRRAIVVLNQFEGVAANDIARMLGVRQLQYTTPRGTRIVWSLNPDLSI